MRRPAAVDDKSVLNRSYCEPARHYGFKIDPTLACTLALCPGSAGT